LKTTSELGNTNLMAFYGSSLIEKTHEFKNIQEGFSLLKKASDLQDYIESLFLISFIYDRIGRKAKFKKSSQNCQKN
jgi:hypothetical protein